MSSQSKIQPSSETEVAESVRAHARIRVVAGGSKPALSRVDDGFVCMDLSQLSGMLHYDPGEFTFSAWAGTPVVQVAQLLEEKGQYLPFDPILGESGATLGGVVAAATNGPGRFRYGGVRDFLIGIHFVDGAGRLIQGGGAVVKNAAGFDFPKLMVGSLGRLGILTRVTFKVFPRPQQFGTLQILAPSLQAALSIHNKILRSQFDIWALDLDPAGEEWSIWVRLAGPESSLKERLIALQNVVGGTPVPVADEGGRWDQMTRVAWSPTAGSLIKIPITPTRIQELEPELSQVDAPHIYSVGGNLLWLSWPDTRERLEGMLLAHNLTGLILRGDFAGSPWLGRQRGLAYLLAVADALGAREKFGLDTDVRGR